jgi:hypothetical protein
MKQYIDYQINKIFTAEFRDLMKKIEAYKELLYSFRQQNSGLVFLLHSGF